MILGCFYWQVFYRDEFWLGGSNSPSCNLLSWLDKLEGDIWRLKRESEVSLFTQIYSHLLPHPAFVVYEMASGMWILEMFSYCNSWKCGDAKSAPWIHLIPICMLFCVWSEPNAMLGGIHLALNSVRRTETLYRLFCLLFFLKYSVNPINSSWITV